MRWYLTNPEREFSEWSPLAIGASIPNVSLPTLEPDGAIHGPSWNILPLTDNPPTVAADRYISARYIRADTESALAIYQTRAKTQEMIDAEVPPVAYVPVYLLRQRVEKLGLMDDFAAYLFQYPPLALKILSLESGVDPNDPNFSAAFSAMQIPQVYQDYILAPASAGVPEVPNG